jgi:hypothetical protein
MRAIRELICKQETVEAGLPVLQDGSCSDNSQVESGVVARRPESAVSNLVFGSRQHWQMEVASTLTMSPGPRSERAGQDEI